MTFQAEKVEDFNLMFRKVKSQIGSFPGVEKLQLLKDTTHPNVFFTYSHWTSLEALEMYRKSKLFQSIWAETKAMFSEKAEAWSTELVEKY